MADRLGWIDRRRLLQLLGVTGGALAANLPSRVFAQARKNTLVLGIDISDTITLDPARLAQYTSPMTVSAAYDSLVTMKPGDYINLSPSLATKWARTPDGKGWRFTLREGVKFSTGNPMTVEDVKWSFDRIINLGDQPSQYIANVDRVEIVDKSTIDIILKQPAEPLLTIIAAPEFVVLERKVAEANGASAAKDAKTADKAAQWINTNSCGTGAYRIAAWERNQQIQLVRNEHYWGGKPPFERIVIRHISDGAAQLLAVRRGDIDAAFNLIPEQIASLKGDANVRLAPLASLDFVYMALTQEPEFNKALAVKEARQAIGYAIDYDGIIKSMLGGAALRPAHFLPIGVSGSTEEIARQIGFKQDLARAKDLLAKAGFKDGFEFEISYGNAAVQGVTYQDLGLKIQSDLARVGIKVNLRPLDQVNLRTEYTTGKSKGGVLTFWNPPAVENQLWAAAVVQRVAKRVHWTTPEDIVKLVSQAATEADPKKQAELWVEWQKQAVDQANHFVLFQPVYQIAVRNTVKDFPLTAAGWMLDLHDVTPSAS
ncbi:MAG: ABC transporter substrate-binding protein [Alphaproteobacteria bacterium]|nr:ABC transporter substrate-binding protein [Alphaproteobacteria bacterium]